jgi:phospholipase C
MSPLSRREFLTGTAAGLASLGLARRGLAARTTMPKPGKSGINHIVVVMVENRSFDHLLGWLPNADGIQAGLIYEDAAGNPFETYALPPDFQGCSHPDPDHSYEGGRVELNDGSCDGWLLANDPFSIGYYPQDALPFIGRAAAEWTVCDRYFSAIMAPTYPNRFYAHCGVTDRLDQALVPSFLPTIWDRLDDAGVSHRYYFSDAPFLSFWGTKYLGIMSPYEQFLVDAAAGTLPRVSYVDPRFAGAPAGVSGDYHPLSDIRAGESWLYQTYRAVTTSPNWKHTVMVINFDEWGGFFDHVPPPEAPDVDPRFQLRGFRVPAIVVSPLARRGYVATNVYDHTSVLKMIEWRWGLDPLSVRDAAANNLAEVLDFSLANRIAGQYDVPPLLSGEACPIIL